MQAAPFLRRARRSHEASLRLFCFPYAGGSEFLFRTWADHLPPTVELCPVLLPGRGLRFAHTPFTRMEPLIESLADALLPYLDRPYALFGHSMGALVSFELVRSLQRREGPLPVRLFASAHPAPQLPIDYPPIHELPDEEFLAELLQYGGTPQEALENAELMQMMVPLLRADFSLCRTYQYTPGPRLSCPITAMGGLGDAAISPSDLKAWEEQATQDFTISLFPGDHFYLRALEAPLVQKIVSQLEATVPALIRSTRW